MCMCVYTHIYIDIGTQSYKEAKESKVASKKQKETIPSLAMGCTKSYQENVRGSTPLALE